MELIAFSQMLGIKFEWLFNKEYLPSLIFYIIIFLKSKIVLALLMAGLFINAMLLLFDFFSFNLYYNH